MVVGLGIYQLRVPGSRSLKEKRQVVRSILGELRTKFNCSASEVDHHDLWQRATVAVSVVAETGFAARKALHMIGKRVAGRPEVELLAAEEEYFSPEA